MSGPGRRAAIAPGDYRRPSIVDETGLVVRPVGQGGEDLGIYDFSGLSGPPLLVREIAQAFATCARTRWDSDRSCLTYYNSLQNFVRAMAKVDPPVASAADITVAVWDRWMDQPGSVSRRGPQVALVLREVPGLSDATRARTTRRFNTPRAPEPKEGFSRAQMKRIRNAAAFTVRTANTRISENLALLERWRSGGIAPGDPDWAWGELLDHLARTGDLPRFASGPIRPAVLALCEQRVGSTLFEDMVTPLFPSVREKGAAAVLLMCYEAWNLSILEKLEIPDQWPNADPDDPDGPAVHRVDTDKPRRRRRRHASNNLLDLGEGTAGWAMQQVISMTAQARNTLAVLGNPSSLLLWSRPARGSKVFSSGKTGLSDAINDWARQARAAGADLPEGVTARPLRHSAQVLHERPRQNSRAVQDSDYLMRDRNVIDQSRDVVAAGLEQAVKHAHATVLMRVAAHVAPGTPREAEQVAKEAGVPLEVAKQVVSGELDTAVGACQDFEHSPFTASGPCAVSFLMCFACPNAVAIGRHLPRIVYLYQCLELIRSAVAGAVWAADWAEHHARVEDLVHKHTDPERWTALLAALPGREREHIDRMLDRRFDS